MQLLHMSLVIPHLKLCHYKNILHNLDLIDGSMVANNNTLTTAAVGNTLDKTRKLYAKG